MAEAMGKYGERNTMQILFSNGITKTKAKIQITPEFTATVTGHGKTKSYQYRFKLTVNLICLCNEGQQSPEHLIYECKRLEF